METEFIYWRHKIPSGIYIEEISGGAGKSPAVWLTMARQIYCENGPDGFRDIGHFENGAPFLFNCPSRISVTHTDGMFAVASLPKTPEADLRVFSERTAMGIDAERADRQQVIRLRERFLNAEELAMVPADSVTANILAWTAKEALYKAALNTSVNWRSDLRIITLPDPEKNTTGEAEIILTSGEKAAMELFSYISDDYIITLAYSPRCAKFKKNL